MTSDLGTHLRYSYNSRLNDRDRTDSGSAGLSSGKDARPGRKVKHSATVRDRILDDWARRDAAKDIAAVNPGLTIAAINGIIKQARSDGDARAISHQPERAAAPIWKPLHRTMGFSSREIFVTTLGTGSVECRRIPISVSCLKTEGDLHG